MARLVFASSIQRHVAAPDQTLAARSMREALDQVFATNPKLAPYLVDDQGHLRKHVAIFVDGRRLRDPVALSDPLSDTSEVFVVQALSGG